MGGPRRRRRRRPASASAKRPWRIDQTANASVDADLDAESEGKQSRSIVGVSASLGSIPGAGGAGVQLGPPREPPRELERGDGPLKNCGNDHAAGSTGTTAAVATATGALAASQPP